MSDDVEAALAAMEDAGQEVEEFEGVDSLDEGEGAQVEQKAERAPLPPEEIEKRWRQTQQALKQERQRVREIEDRYETRFQEALARLTPKQEAQLENKLDLEGIDPEADPMAALKALAGVVKGYKQQAERMTAEQQQEQQRAAAEQNLISRIDRDAAEFSEDYPDYYDGQAHYVGARFAMLENAGYSKAEATQAIKFELMQIGAKALQNGRNPAEAIYRAARAIGFGQVPPEQRGADKLAQIKNGAKAGSKMAGGGAGGSSDTPSFKAIAALKGAAFDAAMEKVLRG